MLVAAGLKSRPDILDKLLSLDIVHAVDTGDTVTAISQICRSCNSLSYLLGSLIPDGEDTASLGKASLFGDATDSLLQDGGDLSGGRFRIGGICASESVDGGRGGALLCGEELC